MTSPAPQRQFGSRGHRPVGSESMDDPQIPVGDALSGLTISPLPEGWTPLEALCMVKSLGEDGSPKWAMRMTEGINAEELLGALVIHTDLLKQDMLNDWADD